MPTHTLTLSSPTSDVTDAFFARQEIGGRPVRFRRSDAFGNLNDVLEPFGRAPYDYLRLPATKRFVKDLATEENVLRENLVGAELGGSYKGTYAHPLLIIHAAQYANPRFGIACHKALLRLASTTGRVLENGDVALRLDAEAMEQAAAPTISSAQVQALLDDVAAMKGDLADLQKSRRTHRVGLQCLLRAHVAQGETSAAALSDMDRAKMRALPASTLKTPATTGARDPNVYDVTRPSLKRMRELVRRRVYERSSQSGEGVGIVWNELYADFKARNGIETLQSNRRGVDQKPKTRDGSTSRLGYIEAIGRLPDLFDLSATLVG